ncbi:MAG: hypothetical protein ABJC62_09955, partial [Frankiaceae bacterium]
MSPDPDLYPTAHLGGGLAPGGLQVAAPVDVDHGCRRRRRDRRGVQGPGEHALGGIGDPQKLG